MREAECEELALWGGYEKIEYLNTSGEVCGVHWLLPDKSNGYPTIPNFFHDMNAGIKYLVPMLVEKLGIDNLVINYWYRKEFIECTISDVTEDNWWLGTGETTAEALANACLKLARGEKP